MYYTYMFGHACILVMYHCLFRVGAQLGLAQMITIEIKVPNRLVGLGKSLCIVP